MIKFATKFFMTLALGLVSFFPVVEAEESNPVLFSIGDENYRLNDFRHYLVQEPSMQVRTTSVGGVRSALNEFVDSKIFRLEGLRTNFSAGAGIEESSNGYWYSVQFSLLGRCPQPDQNQARQFFEANPGKFSTPPLVRMERLALPVNAVIGGRPAEQFLAERLEQLRSKRSNFAALISEVNKAVPTGSAVQGDMGFQMIYADRPESGELDVLAAKAAKGEIIGPIRQDDHLFAFLVTDRRESVPSTWEAVAKTGEVDKAMYSACMTERLDSVRKTLYERFDVKFNDAEVQKLTPIGS